MNNTSLVLEVSGKHVLYSLGEAVQTLQGLSDFFAANDLYVDKSGDEDIMRYRAKVTKVTND